MSATGVSPHAVEEQVVEVSKFASTMQRGYFQKRYSGLSQDDYRRRDTAIGMRRRTKRKPPKPDEIIQILYEVLVEKHPYSFISKKHRVSMMAISKYVSRAKRNPKFL